MSARTGGVVTIQQTSKKWKGVMLTGILMMIASCPTALVASGRGPGDGTTLLVVLFMVLAGGGFITTVVGKIGKWWHHN